MRDYTPNELILNRAAKWWADALRNPKFDNLGDGPASAQERMTSGLAGMMASSIHKTPTDQNLEKFQKELAKSLATPRGSGFFEQSLHVDYGPDQILANAATAAGLEKIQFPWKTGMWIDSNSFSVRYGYGAASLFFYPLTGGRWLTTYLSGQDIGKVIEAVEAGKIELAIEPAVG